MAEHFDWDNEQLVLQAEKELLDQFKYIKETSATDGRTCPSCGSSKVNLMDKTEKYTNLIKVWNCLKCGTKYTQYDLLEQKAAYSNKWPYGVTTFDIEDYPHYIYFRPGTDIFEGIGPNIAPWEE